MTHSGKRIVKARESVERIKLYKLDEAVKLVKKRATAKFDETVELALNLGVDPKHADQMVRGVVNLPKRHRPRLRGRGVRARRQGGRGQAAGADIVGAEDSGGRGQRRRDQFRPLHRHPDMMPLVGRLGKVLGPRGLMPNPKVGTVTTDVTAAVKASKVARRVPRRKGRHHPGLGRKASFGEAQLVQNIRAFVDAVAKAKPAGSKGTTCSAPRSLDDGAGRQTRPFDDHDRGAVGA